MSSPSTYSSLLHQYRDHLDAISMKVLKDASVSFSGTESLSVGIIGGGMTGLYSALLLLKYIPGVQVKIIEAKKRAGGIVYSHHFSEEPYQYFEAGAMRLPTIESHKAVFQLVDYLNYEGSNPSLRLLNYTYTDFKGNRAFFNGTKQKDSKIMSAAYAREHCHGLGFSEAGSQSADSLLKEAMETFVNALESDFQAALVNYDMSVYDYLSRELGWSEEKINYIEVICSHTHGFKIRLLDFYFLCGFFFDSNVNLSWKLIDGGFSNLPEACATTIIKKGGKVFLNSKVESLVQKSGSTAVNVGYLGLDSNEMSYDTFDAVIMAIPPPCIRSIPDRPLWDRHLETTLRRVPSLPSMKLGLRFHSRFWERSDLQIPGSYGGQSSTDLPIRCVVYPSYGKGDKGKGVLLIYNTQGDAIQWIKLSKVEKIKLSLSNLQMLYPEVDIAQEYAGGTNQEDDRFTEEAFEQLDLSVMYYPGQRSSYEAMIKPQGNIFFAGVHLSTTLVWMNGALESAKRAVQQVVFSKYEKSVIDYLQV